MSDQESRHSVRGLNDLRNVAVVVLVLGFVLRGIGGIYASVAPLGTVGVIVGVVLLVAWLIIRAQKR